MSKRGLTLASLRRLRRQWDSSVQRPTLKELKELGDRIGCLGDSTTEEKLRVAQLVQQNITTRIGHRLRDFLFLPVKIMANPAVRDIYDKYAEAYMVHNDFQSLQSLEKVDEYWRALANIFETHQQVTMALGRSRHELVQLEPAIGPVVDSFLDRFFVSRIGTHLLGSQFLDSWPVPEGAKKPVSVPLGVVQKTCPIAYVRSLQESLATFGPKLYAPVELESSGDASIMYIPAHMRLILREVLGNALVATAEMANRHGRHCPPVIVKVHRGQFGVFVTISDRGGGIARPDTVWDWGSEPRSSDDIDYNSMRDPEPASASRGADHGFRLGFVPWGFGLPVARLTARYFGGDVRLQTLSGSGTSAYIHLPDVQECILGSDDTSGSLRPSDGFVH